jgi:hypothetical protein
MQKSTHVRNCTDLFAAMQHLKARKM